MRKWSTATTQCIGEEPNKPVDSCLNPSGKLAHHCYPCLAREGSGESNSEEAESDGHKPQAPQKPSGCLSLSKPCAPPCQHRYRKLASGKAWKLWQCHRSPSKHPATVFTHAEPSVKSLLFMAALRIWFSSPQDCPHKHRG